jgi:hypothetical protein
MIIDINKKWLDNQDVMFMLNISYRTLQFYRDNNILPFSKINGKVFYKSEYINQILDGNYNFKKSQSKKNKLADN